MSIFDDIESALKGNKRVLLGIIGEPGAGKSTLVEEIKAKFPTNELAVLPMDGFHLSNKVLIENGIRHLKGAPQTFDSRGFVALLNRVRNVVDQNIYIPVFHREIEESIANEGVITPEVKVVIVEGNYLLYPELGWGGVQELLDSSYFINISQEVRLERLIARHEKYGKTPEEAREWSLGSDEANAELIRSTKGRATNIIEL
jgi:pantothenate kinase